MLATFLGTSVADPDPDPDPGPWIRDTGSGIGKKSISGSGMNIPDHIFDSLENNFLC